MLAFATDVTPIDDALWLFQAKSAVVASQSEANLFLLGIEISLVSLVGIPNAKLSCSFPRFCWSFSFS